MAIKCAKCHSDNKKTAKFCSECGTALYLEDKMGISQSKTIEAKMIPELREQLKALGYIR